MSGRELVPLTLALHGGVASVDPPPPGAVLDQARGTLRWIPQRGQAGEYRLAVRYGQGIAARQVVVKVEEMTTDALHDGPPSGIYRDGDLGFVFVHGMSSHDLCEAREEVDDYWGSGPKLLAPDPQLRRLVCYDGSQRVANNAPFVAKQLLDAACGRYGRCVAVVHSMGGLMIEHILTHARPARADDPAPELFAEHALYAKVRDKLLFVIAIASAAGGSKAATIGVRNDNERSFAQNAIGTLTRLFGSDTDAVKNLAVKEATTIVAPIDADPGVPIFTVGGFSERILDKGQVSLAKALTSRSLRRQMFNDDLELAMLDYAVHFISRSDALVSFRSACGVASGDIDDGPGHEASLSEQLAYCYRRTKKPNHFPWLLANMNHFFIREPWQACADQDNPCRVYLPNEAQRTFLHDARYDGKSAVDVIRLRTFAEPPRRDGFQPTVAIIKPAA